MGGRSIGFFDKNGNITDHWEMEKDKTRFESAIKKAIES